MPVVYNRIVNIETSMPLLVSIVNYYTRGYQDVLIAMHSDGTFITYTKLDGSWGHELIDSSDISEGMSSVTRINSNGIKVFLRDLNLNKSYVAQLG